MLETLYFEFLTTIFVLLQVWQVQLVVVDVLLKDAPGDRVAKNVLVNSEGLLTNRVI